MLAEIKMLAKLFGFPTRFAQTKIESDFEQQVSKFGFEICANYLVLPDMKSTHTPSKATEIDFGLKLLRI